MLTAKPVSECIDERVLEIVRDTMTAHADEVLQSTSLTVLGVDSLDLVEMVMEFEEVFEIEFDRKRLGDLETLGDVIEEITRLRDESLQGRQEEGFDGFC